MTNHETYTLDLNGRTAPLRVRRHARARNIILRIDAEAGGAVLTLPKRASLREGLELARKKAAWIIERLDALPQRAPFIDGGEVPFLGERRRIVHRPGGRLVTHIDGDIFVGGALEHLARRLTDWLKAEAKRLIQLRAEAFAAKLSRRVGRIAIRDTRSRWGSCSAKGNLNFCWRLVMAPRFVLDYVVAHEVAHLAHMNHGPEFWRAVEDLAHDPKAARRWLRKNGEDLRRYGKGSQ